MEYFSKMPEFINKTTKKQQINGSGYNAPLAPKRTCFNVEKLTPSGLELQINGCLKLIECYKVWARESKKRWPNDQDSQDFYEDLIHHYEKKILDCQDKLNAAHAYLINVQSPKL